MVELVVGGALLFVALIFLGVIGFLAPNIVATVIGHPGPVTSGDLMCDNVFHLLVGIVFLGVGLMRPAVVATTR